MENMNPESLLRKAQALGEDIKEMESIDVMGAYQQAQTQIKTNRRRSMYNQLMRYAAFLTIPLLLSSLILGYLYWGATDTEEKYAEVMAATGSVIRYELPDHSVVWLNSGSTLRYPTVFKKDNRNVELKGEAYFEVAKDPSKPFQVEMNGASITVLGTHFNVKADAESDDITATLVEGSIRFEGAKQNIVMTPNQQLTFNRSTNKVDVKEIDTDTFTAWKDGLLKYKSIPFTELIENLKDIYQVEIRIDDERLADPSITVSGTFNQKQSIEQILKVISHSLPIRWTNKTGNYHIQHAH